MDPIQSNSIQSNQWMDPIHVQLCDNCEVCLIAPRKPRIALVPCGHQRFCSECAKRVRDEGHGCPICRSDITIVLPCTDTHRTELHRTVELIYAFKRIVDEL